MNQCSSLIRDRGVNRELQFGQRSACAGQVVSRGRRRIHDGTETRDPPVGFTIAARELPRESSAYLMPGWVASRCSVVCGNLDDACVVGQQFEKVAIIFEQRSDGVESVNDQSVERPPMPDNGRFLRHRPKRSERCLNYGNCTKAMARCQRAKVCPKGLSVKTMLYAAYARSSVFASPRGTKPHNPAITVSASRSRKAYGWRCRESDWKADRTPT